MFSSRYILLTNNMLVLTFVNLTYVTPLNSTFMEEIVKALKTYNWNEESSIRILLNSNNKSILKEFLPLFRQYTNAIVIHYQEGLDQHRYKDNFFSLVYFYCGQYTISTNNNILYCIKLFCVVCFIGGACLMQFTLCMHLWS